MNFKNWITDHPRIVGVFFLTLAALNAWISYTIYPQHPHMAIANAVMAAALIWGVVLTW